MFLGCSPSRKCAYALFILCFFFAIVLFVLISILQQKDNSQNLRAIDDHNYYGFDTEIFILMPLNTNKSLIMEALNQIVSENPTANFTTSAVYSYNLPYMELLFPDGDDYYVYSSTNGNGYLFTTNNSYLIYPTEVQANPFRFYMWGASVFNLNIQPTPQFPIEKDIQFQHLSTNETFYQKMKLKAKTKKSSGTSYTEITVYRETVYIYYPSYMIYCLVDFFNQKIYIMQTGNNQKTGNTPLSYANMIYNLNLIELPENFLFLSVQLNNSQTICVVSSSEQPAVLIQDSIGNSYQLSDRKYANFLYQQFFD